MHLVKPRRSLQPMHALALFIFGVARKLLRIIFQIYEIPDLNRAKALKLPALALEPAPRCGGLAH
jgi:hypothetical protein